MPYLGDVFIDVIEEFSFDESAETTDHALEDGEQITDHIDFKPITMSLKGIIKDEDESKRAKLREYMQKGEVLSFQYVSKLDTCVITSFQASYAKGTKDGYTFTMGLKQIRFVQVKNNARVSKSVKRQTKSKTNAGRKQVKKK